MKKYIMPFMANDDQDYFDLKEFSKEQLENIPTYESKNYIQKNLLDYLVKKFEKNELNIKIKKIRNKLILSSDNNKSFIIWGSCNFKDYLGRKPNPYHSYKISFPPKKNIIQIFNDEKNQKENVLFIFGIPILKQNIGEEEPIFSGKYILLEEKMNEIFRIKDSTIKTYPNHWMKYDEIDQSEFEYFRKIYLDDIYLKILKYFYGNKKITENTSLEDENLNKLFSNKTINNFRTDNKDEELFKNSKEKNKTYFEKKVENIFSKHRRVLRKKLIDFYKMHEIEKDYILNEIPLEFCEAAHKISVSKLKKRFKDEFNRQIEISLLFNNIDEIIDDEKFEKIILMNKANFMGIIDELSSVENGYLLEKNIHLAYDKKYIKFNKKSNFFELTKKGEIFLKDNETLREHIEIFLNKEPQF